MSREDWERDILATFPDDGRTIRIKPTPETKRMGIAGWEGFKQGTINPYIWYFAPSGTLPGDSKIGIPWGIEWWYVEEMA
jgi:hypothetical protein